MSFSEYVKAGWRICAILPGQKSPTAKRWNERGSAIADPGIADVLSGAGLLHAYSGTCALDIDDFNMAAVWLGSKGINLPELWDAPDAVRIVRGDPNRGKLLFSLSEPLATKRISMPTGNLTLDNRAEVKTVLEFRCASANGTSMQDVLPPTLHPSGEPYSWQYAEPIIGDWRTLPQLPDDLRALWVTCGGELAPVTPAKKVSTGLPDIEDIRDAIEFLDPNVPRAEWLAVLMDMVYLTQGSTEGYQLFDQWSAGATNGSYKGKRDTKTQWDSIDYRKARYVGFLTIPSGPEAFEDLPVIPPTQSQSIQMQASANRIATIGSNKIARNDFIGRMVFLTAADRYYDREAGIMIQSDHALRQIYRPFMPRAAGIPEDPLKVLEVAQGKRVVYATAFHPGAGEVFVEGDKEYLNEYKPSLVPELDPTTHELDTLEWLFNRIHDKSYRRWLMQWFGYSIQYPGEKIMSAPLIWSEQEGSGKGTLLQKIPELLYGPQYCHNVSHDSLSSTFTDYLIGKWYIHLSELYTNARGDRSRIAGKLKAIITDSIEIHPKGRPAYTVPNRLLVTASSNEAGAALLSANDRRWGVHELDVPEFTDDERVAVYDKFLNTGRAAGVLRKFFLNMDLDGFNPKAHAIRTVSREEMIDISESDWVTMLREGMDEQREEPFNKLAFHVDDVRDYLKRKGVFVPSPNALGRKLRTLGFNKVLIDFEVNDGRKRVNLWVTGRNSGLPHKQYYDAWQNGSENFDILS